MRVHYKKKTSNYTTWEQKEHAEDYLLYPENVKENLSIDEVSLSQGEHYTFVTNKSHNGRKGSLVGCIKGTKSEGIMRVLNKLPKETRSTVKEITLDMAPNMALASKKCFENAALTTDRFHVVKLVNEAMQHLRVKLRCKAIDAENEAIKEAKKKGKKYAFKEFENGDTPKQLFKPLNNIIFFYSFTHFLRH